MAASEPWRKLGRDYNTCLKAVTAPLREVYAAKAEGKPLGFIILEMTGTFRGYIKTVCVAPGARGRGLGTKLVLFAEKRIFRESPNVFMCVSSFNLGARRLYHRLGYIKTGELKDFIVKGHNEILLRKTLGPLNGFVSGRKAVRALGRF
jgi:ribosomal protein S18 acetylase RimI-like enzyme